MPREHNLTLPLHLLTSNYADANLNLLDADFSIYKANNFKSFCISGR